MKKIKFNHMRKVNYIAVDKKSAISSYGQEFNVGEVVSHDDKQVGEATILSFELDESTLEVKVNTTKGWAHLDFIVKK